MNEAESRTEHIDPAEKRIVMLHSFIKKSERTPKREREIAKMRMKEIKRANA